ncbi:hypothetical protein M0811_03352 [Anaeramoeba ignava]|uniref:Uncharacterized protein n=1 Tax=Anaeramoeba ignava TaxID=1746090 RepID=A0A9Q0L6M8_ANAIG|nr:hypothetical protein M0811_03352 [Anaeramoeba ignava]
MENNLNQRKTKTNEKTKQNSNQNSNEKLIEKTNENSNQNSNEKSNEKSNENSNQNSNEKTNENSNEKTNEKLIENSLLDKKLEIDKQKLLKYYRERKAGTQIRLGTKLDICVYVSLILAIYIIWVYYYKLPFNL